MPLGARAVACAGKELPTPRFLERPFYAEASTEPQATINTDTGQFALGNAGRLARSHGNDQIAARRRVPGAN